MLSRIVSFAIIAAMLAAMLFTVPFSALAAASEQDFEFDPETGTILRYVGDVKVVDIPPTINGVQVKTIGDEAFAKTAITLVKLPGRITAIGDGAFDNCPELTLIVIPSSVTSIGDNAFNSYAAGFRIYCNKGSRAEKYASSKGISFSYLGDIDNNKSISANDALYALRSVSGGKPLTRIQQVAGDVNYDDKITSMDALHILQYVSGRKAEF